MSIQFFFVSLWPGVKRAVCLPFTTSVITFCNCRVENAAPAGGKARREDKQRLGPQRRRNPRREAKGRAPQIWSSHNNTHSILHGGIAIAEDNDAVYVSQVSLV